MFYLYRFVTNINFQKQKISCDDPNGHHIIHQNELLCGRYRTIKLLGQGTFGKVIQAVDIYRNCTVAIKIGRATERYRLASKWEAHILNELKEHDPSNLHRCIHLLRFFTFQNHVCLIFEILGMSLYAFLKSNNFIPFPASHLQSIARQLLDCVAFIHGLQVIHTDIKPENILLVNDTYTISHTTNPAQNVVQRILNSTTIRLIDFGSATQGTSHHRYPASTRQYRAPEMILGLGWSYPLDLYSVGCVLVELFTGRTLFQAAEDLEHLAMMEAVTGKMKKSFALKGANSRPTFFREDGFIDWPNSKTTTFQKEKLASLPHITGIIPADDTPRVALQDMVQQLLDFDPIRRMTAEMALSCRYFSMDIQEGTE
ncbi:kinase-like protein [Favolaschia claudopus]|uniref:Kinase-like protein n=1 Tax=Favolaschia claudopus TaxID=2862362 RepID=A0AAW0A2M9_9AGAR